jgi:CelD/BcsL family acetyltransferase involved in cellulose biosynthesis
MAACEPIGRLEEAREAWQRLGAETANVFSTWEWAQVWWRHFGAGRQLALAAVRQGPETIGILPMHTERRGVVRLARFIGHGVGDELGPVCAAQDASTVAGCLEAWPPGGSLLLAERLPGRRDWAEALGGRMLKIDSSPVIDLAGEGSWDGYLSARSANFRQQVRRRGRRLERLGIRFRLAQDQDRLAPDLDALVALHRAHWGERSRAFAPRREGFHREFAALALEQGWLRLWVAEVDGTPVAAWYGFRFAGVDSFYQSGRDPSWDRSAVGAGLLEHTMREAFADGMREYRLLRGDEAYKSRYATRDPALQTVARGRSLPGRLLVSAAGRLAAHPRARRALTRRADA